MGRIVKLETDGTLVVRFLDLRANNIFVYRNDTEVVEKKWVFHRGAKVVLEGRKGYLVQDLEVIRQKFSDFKKQYLLKQKVSASTSIHFTIS